ncbi:MAG: leucine-rich repeat protein [Clostridiales bacterium]|nr:leucine-rich repeat protein [Clostridiales bacterium]
MQNVVNTYLEKFKKERHIRRRVTCILLALALVVGSNVYWQLRLTGAAATNETFCGMEEHTHSEDCYEQVLTCGLEESEGHTHTDACYETETTLVCGLEESEEHTHDDSCYETEQVLVCGEEESEGHTHTDDCYEEQLVCGLEEHTHTVECLTDETADVETSDDWEATLPADLTGVWAEDVVSVAESQLGYTESTANFTLDEDGTTRRGYTRYGAWAGNKYGAWDAMFASFCLYYAGISQDEFPEATGAYSWVATLKEKGLYEGSDYTAAAGDLVFFDSDEDGKADHVGIVTEVNEKNGKLTVIEGDCEDAVAKNTYAADDSTIIGYGTVSEAQEQAEDSAAEETVEAEDETETESEIASEVESEAETEDGATLTQQTLTATVDSATITVSGLLPEGAAVTATPVEVENDELNIVMAFDISIYNADGTVFEPEDDTISVTIQSDEISGDNEVYYISDAGDAEKMQSTSEDGTVTFDAEHFSTYALTVAEEVAVVASGTCGATDEDNVTWTVYSDGTIVINGTGAMADYSTQSEQPWYDYMTKSSECPITDIVIGAGVTHIGDRAFYGASNVNQYVAIKSITFEDESNLTSIGDYAFAPADSGEKNTVLESLELPEGLETIGNYAFYQYIALTNLTIPDSVTSIGNYAFYYCSSLTSLTFGADSQLTSIGSHAFYEADSLVNVTLPEKLTSIGDNAFTNCDNLNSIELPDSLISIGSSAFSGCTALNSITIPASVTSIGSSAFNQCSGLRTVTFGDGSELTAISDSTFKGCTSLTSINLPDSVTSIGNYAFSGCTALTDINLPDDLTELGSYAFYNCSALTEIDIPDGVTAIEDYTFYGCTNLATVNLPDGLTSIGAYAFYNDTALTGVALPDDLTSIGAYAFYHTDSLTDITIPNAVESIGAYAFYNSGLTEVTFKNTDGIEFGAYAFARSSDLASVNGETTLSGAMALLGVTDNSVFYQTALTDMTTTETQEAIKITHTDAEGNEVDLTINQTKNSDGTVDYGYLTGEYAFTTVHLESRGTDLSNETCRIYIQFDNDGGVIRSSDSSGTTTTWTVGEKNEFTTSGMKFYVTLYQVEGVDGFYYLEFDNLEAGATLEFTFATTYPNGVEGGSALIYAEIEGEDETNEDGTPANEAYKAQKITWTTDPEDYTVTKKSGSTASFAYSAEDGAVYLTGLKFTITTSKTSTHTINSTSYGRDYVAVATFSDTLTLPGALSWRDGLADAINAGNWYVTSSKVVHVIVYGTDYVLCTLSGGSSTSSGMSIISLTVPDNGSITMTWTVKQSSTSSDISTSDMTVTYSDDVIKYTGTETVETSQTYTVTNTVNAEYTFNYSDETQKSESTATASAKLSQGTLTLDKTPDTGTYYMGSAYTYTITAKNTEALAYSGLRYIEDTLGDWLYLEPDEMESLLNDDHSLTITLNNATLYTVVSDMVTTTDGGSATIDQQMEGTNTSYTGNQVTQQGGSTSGTLESNDTVKDAGVTVVFAWVNDALQMTVTYSDNKTETYTIGTSSTYTSISEALHGIGYFVTNNVTYTLLWDLGEDYSLPGNSSLTYSYSATVKDTFMRLEGDQYWDIDQNADTINSSNVSLGTQNLNIVSAYGADGTDSTALKTKTVTGTVYRDFSLSKDLSVSRDGTTLSDTANATDGDIVKYTVQVKHEGTASYNGLPLVDKMAAGQVLLAPVASNTQLADLGLVTETVDGVAYYRLSTTGTYKNVTIYGSTVADKVVVNEDGSTLIYCYLNVSGSATKTLHYLAVIDADADENAEFSLVNQAWLNDHETHRLYVKTIKDGSVLTIEKQIVTEKGDTPAVDETTSRTILSGAGTQVTYRLALENNSDNAVTITGADIYDALPANASDDPWTTDDITVTIVTDDVTVTPTDLSGWTTATTGWSITNDDPSTENIETAETQCYLVWYSDLTLTFTGTVYFYVTLTYPGSEEEWDAFTDTNLSNDLTNVLHVFKLESQVSHGIIVETKASLYKGVLETGLASAKSSSASYYATTDKDGLWYYTNDSAGEYGYVQYYVVLYNEGPVNLYLNTLEDVLPDGFTYDTYKTPTATTDLTVTDSEGEPVTCVNFTVTATYDSSANKVSFDLSGGDLGYSTDYERYYLAPGEAAVFTYYVWTNAYSSTSSPEINTIAMPFYDYSGGGVSLSDEVSNKTVSWDTSYNRNDGSADLWNAAKAEESGMTGTGDDWLASTVTVSRNQIKPGIEKTTSSDTAGSNETLTWSVKVTNDGESTMTSYVLYDVIQSPYYFTGQLSYTVYDGAGNSTTYIIGTLSKNSSGNYVISAYKSTTARSPGTTTLSSSSSTVYAYPSGNTSDRYPVFLSVYEDSDGNLVLYISFTPSSTSTNYQKDIRAFSLPSGGYGVLSIKTTSDSSTNYNGVITNTAYVRPSQTFDEGDIGSGTEVLPTDGDQIVGARHAVNDEASIAVSFGYSTTSSKSVTEVGNDGTATTNTATSTSKDASITVGSTSSTVRYTLTVDNGNEAMDELVLLDNLPEEDDTMTLTSAARKSEYTVLLASNPNFTVTVTPSGGTAITLTEGTDYEIQYSTSSSVGEDDLDASNTNGWNDEIPEGATVRSFRIIFNLSEDTDGTYSAGDYIPANATVTVTFDATIYSDTVSAGATAYNSFGYRYSAASSDGYMSASPRKVGVQVPTAPTLVKKLVESDGTTEATAKADTDFTFLIYQGETTVSGSTLDELITSLGNAGITTYTTEIVTVKAGESASESVLLGDLNQYTITYNEEDGTYTGTESTTAWTWTDKTKYTIIEIPDENYDFASWNTTTTTNKYTFTYDSSEDITLTCVNKEQTWTLTLYKVDAANITKTLSGAVFALYGKTNTNSTYSGVDSELTIGEGENEVTWYLYGVQTTGDNGTATWSGLAKGVEYYLVEVKAPDGYNLTDTAQIVAQTSNETAVTVTVENTAGYELPSAGGDGIWLYILTGTVLCCGAAVVLLRRKAQE